jgi:peptide/nickel transport system substrate-binding protein
MPPTCWRRARRSIRNDPKLKLAFLRRRRLLSSTSSICGTRNRPGPTSGCEGGEPRIDRQALSAAIARRLKVNGNIVLKSMPFALPIDPDPFDPVQAKKLLAEAGYPNGFVAAISMPCRHTSPPEAIIGYLGAIGIRTRLRTMERAAFFAALTSKKLKGLSFAAPASTGNAPRPACRRSSEPAATLRMAGTPTSTSCISASSPRRTPAEEMLHQIRGTLHERTASRRSGLFLAERDRAARRGSLADEDRSLPWAAPLEDV